MELTDREWKCFDFVDIFDIHGGYYNKKPDMADGGTIPFLGATENNNGITGWCSIQEIERASRAGDDKNDPISKKMFSGNCIVVTNDGSVGHAYYHETEFTCSHSVNILYLRHEQLNLPIAIFLISAIEKQAVCFEYARKWRPSRMVRSKLLLPVTDDGQPDYCFMEQYIKDLMLKKYFQYNDYQKARIS